MKKRIISFILCVVMCCAIFATGPYKGGIYCENLQKCFSESGFNTGEGIDWVNGKQRHDIVLFALTQKGYHESNSSADLSGEGTGTGNYSEYGRIAGNNGAAWGGYFIYWLGLQVGCSQNLMALATKPYDSKSILVGDIVMMRNGQNRGIVTKIQGGYIWIIEGNYSDKVTETRYSINSSDITGYVAPNYGDWNPRLIYYPVNA